MIGAAANWASRSIQFVIRWRRKSIEIATIVGHALRMTNEKCFVILLFCSLRLRVALPMETFEEPLQLVIGPASVPILTQRLRQNNFALLRDKNKKTNNNTFCIFRAQINCISPPN